MDCILVTMNISYQSENMKEKAMNKKHFYQQKKIILLNVQYSYLLLIEFNIYMIPMKVSFMSRLVI